MIRYSPVLLTAIFSTLATTSYSQAPKSVPDGPASAELRAMAKADQDDRTGLIVKKNGKMVFEKPTPEQEKQIVASDRKRRTRLIELLRADKLTMGEDFDHAALIFQHQATPDDFLAAHELAIIAGNMGKFGSMPALAEDRFLTNIKRKQRFGSQYGPASHGARGYVLDSLEEGAPTSVTDGLRAEMLIAPLALVRRDGADSMRTAMPAIFERLEREHDPKWLSEAAKRPESTELQRLAATPDNAGTTRALELYHSDKLETPEDYRNAAILIRQRPDSGSQILAHELASVAFIRGDKKAGPVLTETLDSFLAAIGRPTRYKAGSKSETLTDSICARFDDSHQ